jgi:plastocyanin
MMSARSSLVAATGIVATTVALVGGCFSERTHEGGPVGPISGECRIPVSSPIVGSTGAIVAIRNFSFHPATITVKPGTTVTWINCENEGIDDHTSTSDDGVWDSPFLEPGQTFSHTFGAAGTFDYHCIPHPSMRAMVIVE